MSKTLDVAEIVDGVVVNVVVVDPDEWPENCKGWPVVSDGAWIGWRYSDGKFIAPPEIDEEKEP